MRIPDETSSASGAGAADAGRDEVAITRPPLPKRPPRQGLVSEAFADIVAALKRRRVWVALASEDIGEGFRRTTLGPLWLLINYLLFLGILIVVMGRFADVPNYPAYIASGLLVWLYISEILVEGCGIFTREEGFIKGTVLPLSIYVLRQTMRSVIRGGYMVAGAAIVLLWTGAIPTTLWLTSLGGILVLVLTAPAVIILLGILGVIFPDIQFFMGNIIRVGFFVTPIFWSKPSESGLRALLYQWNPFTYYLDIVRTPIIFDTIALHSWAMVGLMSGGLWIAAILALGYYRRRIVFMI